MCSVRTLGSSVVTSARYHYDPEAGIAQFGRGELPARPALEFARDYERANGMKFRHEIDIDASRPRVWRAFDALGNRSRWQPGFKTADILTGKAGQPGCVLKVTLERGGRIRQVIEQVTERREPDFLATQADDGNGRATTVYHFEQLDGNRTRWVVYTGYVTHGLKRLFAPLFRQGIADEIETTLNRFKLMVESDAGGRPA